jgi:hypothetical protein
VILRRLKSTFQNKQKALAEELSALRAAEQAIRAEATLAEREGKRFVTSRKLSSLVLYRVNIIGSARGPQLNIRSDSLFILIIQWRPLSFSLTSTSTHFLSLLVGYYPR